MPLAHAKYTLVLFRHVQHLHDFGLDDAFAELALSDPILLLGLLAVETLPVFISDFASSVLHVQRWQQSHSLTGNDSTSNSVLLVGLFSLYFFTSTLMTLAFFGTFLDLDAIVSKLCKVEKIWFRSSAFGPVDCILCSYLISFFRSASKMIRCGSYNKEVYLL